MKQSVANSKIMLCEKCCEIPKIIICLQEDIIINVKCSCEKKDKTLDAFFKENVKDVNTYKTEGKCCLMDENDNSSSHFNNVKFCIQCGKWFCDNCQKNHNSIIDKDCAIMYDWKMNLHDDNNNAAKPYKLPHLFQNYRLNYNQFCSKHPTIKATQYCKFCDKNYCKECQYSECPNNNNNIHNNTQFPLKMKYREQDKENWMKSTLKAIEDYKKTFNDFKSNFKNNNNDYNKRILNLLNELEHKNKYMESLIILTQDMYRFVMENMLNNLTVSVNLEHLSRITIFKGFDFNSRLYPIATIKEFIKELGLIIPKIRTVHFKLKIINTKSTTVKDIKVVAPYKYVNNERVEENLVLFGQDSAISYLQNDKIEKIKFKKFKGGVSALCEFFIRSTPVLAVGKKNSLKVYLDIPFNATKIISIKTSNKKKITILKAIEDGKLAFVTDNSYCQIWNFLTNPPQMETEITLELSKTHYPSSLLFFPKNNMYMFSQSNCLILYYKSAYSCSKKVVPINEEAITCLKELKSDNALSTKIILGFVNSGIQIRDYDYKMNYISEKKEYHGHKKSIVNVFQLLGNLIISCSEDGLINVWKMDTFTTIKSFDLTIQLKKEEFSPPIIHCLLVKDNLFIVTKKNQVLQINIVEPNHYD